MVCTLVGTVGGPWVPGGRTPYAAFAARMVGLSFSRPEAVADPTPGGIPSFALRSVSCASAMCMAVGEYLNAAGNVQTLAEQYRRTGNLRSWRYVRSPRALVPRKAMRPSHRTIGARRRRDLRLSIPATNSDRNYERSQWSRA